MGPVKDISVELREFQAGLPEIAPVTSGREQRYSETVQARE